MITAFLSGLLCSHVCPTTQCLTLLANATPYLCTRCLRKARPRPISSTGRLLLEKGDERTLSQRITSQKLLSPCHSQRQILCLMALPQAYEPVAVRERGSHIRMLFLLRWSLCRKRTHLSAASHPLTPTNRQGSHRETEAHVLAVTHGTHHLSATGHDCSHCLLPCGGEADECGLRGK